MKKIFLFIAIALPLMMLAQDITPIAQIQENINQYNGHEVTIEGVVTIGAGLLYDTRLQCYLQDESGKGIQAFDYDITNAYEQAFVRGNRLQITGTIEEYNGVTEITDFDFEIMSTGNLIPMTDLTVSEMGNYQTWEGSMTWFSGVVTDSYSAGGGLNVTLENTSGEEMLYRLWDSCDVDPDIAVGDQLVAKGVISSYNGSPQLLPAYLEDFTPFSSVIQPNLIFSEDDITVKVRVEWPENIATMELQYALQSDMVYHTLILAPIDGVDRGYQGTVPPLNTLTDASDNYVFRYVGKDSAGSTLVTGDPIAVVVYTGVPFIEGVEFYSQFTETYNFIQYPFNDERITIVAEVVDDLGEISEVAVHYGLKSQASMDSVLILEPDDGNLFEGDLPAMTDITELDDDFVFQVWVTDDADNVIHSEEIEIVVAPRAPVVYDMEFLNVPQPGEDLEFGVNIWDTDGDLTEQFIQYQLDYSSDGHTAPLVRDTTYSDTTRYIGVIPGKSSGTTVFAHVVAYDNDGYSTYNIPGYEEMEVEYTYPVFSHKAILKVPPHPFNPYAGETLPIDFYSKQGDKVLLRIYSSSGKLVHTAKNFIIDDENGINRFEWDGKNRSRSVLPLGMYICHLEVTETDTGNKKTAKAPIVIGAPLK